jgi:hypothetical protein
MKNIDPGTNFFGLLVFSECDLEELIQFRDHMGGFLAHNPADATDKAHSELELELFSPPEETFRPILHSSIIISTVVLLEREMRDYSTALLDAVESDLRFNDLSGNVLDRFMTVVTKIAKLPLNLTNVRWEDVNGLFEIRNCLVHAGGYLPEFAKASAIRAFAARHGTPDHSEGTIDIDALTSEVALEVASVFLEGIYAAALAAFPKV